MDSAAGQKQEPTATGGIDPLLLEPGHELSKKIKAGTLTATKLCQVYIERIKRVQPKVNCMAEDRFEAALREAGKIDELVTRYRQAGADTDDSKQAAGAEFTREQVQMLESPLLGVPISIKESIQVKGMINSCGVWDRRNVRAEQDAVVVNNIKAYGMIPICTTNIPEWTLFWADCQNVIYGRTRNPYDSSRVTGASSGGEGALLASAGSLMGVGSDIGGSLRSPAHYCGVFSHKCSPFLVSPEGNYPELKEARLRMFTLGPMCRYASDMRHLLRVLLSDVNNPKRDTHVQYQPKDIGEIRERVIAQLDGPALDLSQVKLFYCDFKQVSRLRALFGSRERRVQTELMEAQQEVLNHFATKFNCQIEHLDLNKYMDNLFNVWAALMACGASKYHETDFEENELKKVFGVNNVGWEMFKWFIGASEHTKEILLGLAVEPIPTKRKKAYKWCEKMERRAQTMRDEVEAKLGPNGVIIMPTLPTVAKKHHYSLLKTEEARFPALFNILPFTATHAPIRLDKKRKLPYGVTIASRAYNDHITISMAEEIEKAFGGWTVPQNLTP